MLGIAKKRLIEIAVVALMSLIILGFGVQRAGIASGYVDPFLEAGAQDEAVYGHAAASMVHLGHWLTPTFLGRYMLNKPPLLMWAGALGMRILGANPLSLRLPVIAAGALCCVLVYMWLQRRASIAAALSGVLLLLGNSIFHAMSRRFMTDMLLTALVVACMFILSYDSRIERTWSAAGFGLLAGAAILTKSAAGLLPILVLVLYLFLLPQTARPALRRLLLVATATVAIAAPWHVYQFIAHRDWFTAEYIRFQLFDSGVLAPSRYSGESNLGFYAQRLLEMDPVLLLLWCVALRWAGFAWKQNDWHNGEESSQVRLLAAWCICSFAIVLVFGTRVSYYLLPLLPALAIMSVRFSPLFRGRWAIVMCGALAAAFVVKAANGRAAWGVDYGTRSVPPAAALENYSRLHRANDLVIVAPDDQFYATVLHIPTVRYLYPGALDQTKTADFFRWLGVNVSPQEFCDLPSLKPVFARRLESWNEPSAAPIGAMIFGSDDADVSTVIRCSPERDFLLPDRFRDAALEFAGQTHDLTPSKGEHFFLLSKQTARRSDAAPAAGALIAHNVFARDQGLVASSATLVTTAPSSRPSPFVAASALSRAKFAVTKVE